LTIGITGEFSVSVKDAVVEAAYVLKAVIFKGAGPLEATVNERAGVIHAALSI